MKSKVFLIMAYIGSSCVGIASIVSDIAPAVAGGRGFSSVMNALAYPTSSELFFREGRRQFEPEIARLQKGDDIAAADLLTVSASNSQQLKELQEQERQLWEQLERSE